MQASERHPEMANTVADAASVPEPDQRPMAAPEAGAAQKLGFVMGWELDDLCAGDGDGQC